MNGQRGISLPARGLTLVALLAALTAATFGTAQEGLQVLDQGTFVVQQGPVPLGQGLFTLVRLTPSTVQLLDHTRLDIPQGPTVIFTATLQADAQLNPFLYTLNLQDPQGLKTIVVQMENGTAQLLVAQAFPLVAQREETVSTRTFNSDNGFVLMDNNLFGQMALLYRQARMRLGGEGEGFDSTALIPQIEEALPVRIERVEPVDILHGDQTSLVDRISIRIGGTPQLELLGEGDRFLGMAPPGESIPIVYRSDLFPEGFTIQRP